MYWKEARQPGTWRTGASPFPDGAPFAASSEAVVPACEAVLFLEPRLIRGLCCTVGPGDEKHTRALTD